MERRRAQLKQAEGGGAPPSCRPRPADRAAREWQQKRMTAQEAVDHLTEALARARAGVAERAERHLELQSAVWADNEAAAARFILAVESGMTPETIMETDPTAAMSAAAHDLAVATSAADRLARPRRQPGRRAVGGLNASRNRWRTICWLAWIRLASGKLRSGAYKRGPIGGRRIESCSDPGGSRQIAGPASEPGKTRRGLMSLWR